MGTATRGWAIPADISRTDVDKTYNCGEFHGFDYTITEIPAGTHTLYIYANDQYLNTSTFIGAFSVQVEDETIPPENTFHFSYSVDCCIGGQNSAWLKGWVFNEDNITKPIQIHAYLDGGVGMAVKSWAIPADISRIDIGNTYNCGEFHGFDYIIDEIPAGQHKLYLYANDQYLNTSEFIGIYMIEVEEDNIPPEISNVRIIDLSSSGYTIVCTVTDNKSIKKVAFPTWTVPDDQDDIFYDWGNNALGTIDGNTISYRVKTEDHGWQTGCKYITHIYAWDTSDNIDSVNQEMFPELLVYVPVSTELLYTLPDNLYSIGPEAFSSLPVVSIVCPPALERIEEDAFSYCENLVEILIPENVKYIDSTAFTGCSNNLTIRGKEGSYAQKFAEEHNIEFIWY